MTGSFYKSLKKDSVVYSLTPQLTDANTKQNVFELSDNEDFRSFLTSEVKVKEDYTLCPSVSELWGLLVCVNYELGNMLNTEKCCFRLGKKL